MHVVENAWHHLVGSAVPTRRIPAKHLHPWCQDDMWYVMVILSAEGVRREQWVVAVQRLVDWMSYFSRYVRDSPADLGQRAYTLQSALNRCRQRMG
jgi:hypothetical protein